MSHIAQLNVSCIRNIIDQSLTFSPSVNLLYGENGSGKTSLLEAIHLLAAGRSFRNSKIDPIINHDSDEAVIFAELGDGSKIGMSKSRKLNHQLQLQSERQRNWDEVARLLPVQILDSTSFGLLEGGPKARRRYLDWGVFHVEQRFLINWRATRQCLANRNFLLKQRPADKNQIAAWDVELGNAANLVDLARQAYFEQLAPQFYEVYKGLCASRVQNIVIEYYRGWDRDRDLISVLADNFHNDTRYGSTQNGPHRADIIIRVEKSKAVDILSRGQQKMLVSALKIAQGRLLSQIMERQAIYLVDDLPAELDSDNRVAVVNNLIGLGGQIFITCVDRMAMERSLKTHPQLATFHVERGIITA
jgi:DNA replication and repair protein RecF